MPSMLSKGQAKGPIQLGTNDVGTHFYSWVKLSNLEWHRRQPGLWVEPTTSWLWVQWCNHWAHIQACFLFIDWKAFSDLKLIPESHWFPSEMSTSIWPSPEKEVVNLLLYIKISISWSFGPNVARIDLQYVWSQTFPTLFHHFFFSVLFCNRF